MQDAEIKKIIESRFQPYHCGVQLLPVYETHKESLWLRVSNVDDSLIYEDEVDLKAAREDLDQHITWWREGATSKGFKLDPL
jgi:hypothetical protein